MLRPKADQALRSLMGLARMGLVLWLQMRGAREDKVEVNVHSHLPCPWRTNPRTVADGGGCGNCLTEQIILLTSMTLYIDIHQ